MDKEKKNTHHRAVERALMAKQQDKGSRYASAKASQFFKIILSSEPRLRLPKKFVKKYGHSLPCLVSLEARKGPIFQVQLIRSDGEIWFEKGFQDFKNYYSIGFGYFLVFTYNEDFYFHVAIFDTSAVEIEYPYAATKQKHRKMFEKSSIVKEEREIDSDDSVEILARIPTWQKGKRSEQNAANPVYRKVSVEVLDGCLTKQNSKRKRRAADDDVSIEILEASQTTMRKPDILSNKKASIQKNGVKCERTRTNPCRRCSKQEIRKECNTYSRSHLKHPISGSAQTITAKEEFLAYQKAKAFKSRNPSFVSFMQPSYVSGSFMLSIPRTFAQNYLACKKHCDVVLCVSQRRTWKVRCCIGSHNARLLWKKFVHDNGLQVGDACVFECRKNTKCSILNVIIFRTIEDAEDCQENSAKEDSIKVLGDYPTKQEGMGKRPKVEDSHAFT